MLEIKNYTLEYIKGKKGITIKDIYNKFSLQGENKKNSGGNKGNFITYVKISDRFFIVKR